jgi:hypothetical protein
MDFSDSDFTQSYRANVGELLEIWNFRICRPAAFCHIIFDLLFIIDPLTPNDLKRRRTVSPLKNLGRQRFAEGFNSGVKGLIN